ncbi:adenosylcobinamide-GDP ribazoletransferase [Amylibacter sp. IMCC11727]|uniref:adenosylcobinamide-GDP ribazoletransferase n=1 Tax=Amylibacter sp. IMCC11727 TaxID=3039851 RepID=UPI00244DA270|nr:adenosylcobinamide-GDP ribazoletransferase [Amylibacter sp. IMCC11727]WGI23048.1 adenosylcobinamide-GDP ribazoletransferase [Amylibacter sp. IMCC11727]
MDKTKNWLTQLDVQPIDIPAAFTLLTRLPLPVDHAKTGERAARAAWAYPFVGAVLGLIAGVIALSLAAFGVQTGIAAAVALGTLMLLTGALHEDGLSDCADGLGGGTTLKKRLEIMKDSRIGAFGAAALGVTLLARWSGYDAVITVDWLWAFVAVGTASRLPMVLVMYGMPLSRPDGLAATVGLVTAPIAIIATLLTVILCVISIGLLALPMLIVMILACLPLCWLAWRRIEGYTGDVLGGCQQIAEIAALAMLTTIL